MLKISNATPILALLSLLALSGCGTWTPIPAQGGGKRFAMEQAMISASARKAISDIPLEKLRGKNVALEVSVVQDEGGGAITLGGRPYAASIFTGQQDQFVNNGVKTNTSSVGGRVDKSEPSYFKDITFNGSDAKQFTNLLVSAMLRQNILVNPAPESNKKTDYILEVLVDIFGIWRSRTDWLVYNAETLTATTSLEYVVTPLQNDEGQRLVARVGYDATFRENYAFWIGPYETEVAVKPSKFSEIVGTFGIGGGGFDNLQNEKVLSDFAKPSGPAPIILNPNDASFNRERAGGR
jgi:hypothetical protein